VAGYLDRSIYYVNARRTGTFVLWNNQRHWAATDAQLLAAVRQQVAEHRRDVLVILSQPWDAPPPDARLVGETASLTSAPQESYFIYRIPYAPPAP
jgi:hypothetical protein